MAKKIKFGLSVKSVENAIRQLEDYRNELRQKMAVFMERLQEVGISTINVIMSSIPNEEKGDYSTESDNIVARGNHFKTGIRLTGDKVLFVEFSAGVTYGMSGSQYPTSAGAEYGVGTYPDQTHAYDPDGWWYKGEDGKSHHSFGNPAYMPMFNAERSIGMEVHRIAKEVFVNGGA